MQKKLNLLNSASRKVISISLVLFMSFNFSVLGVRANICKGGPGCANCIELAHSHMPGDVAGMENYSCRPGAINTDCGFQTGRMPDDANHIALTDRSAPYTFSGIFLAESDAFTRPKPCVKLSSPFDSPKIEGAIPIYLLNDSLLC